MMPYAEPSKPHALSRMRKARETNKCRSETDRAAGFRPPEDAGDFSMIRTAMRALACSLDVEDWDMVAEALVLLQGMDTVRAGHIAS